MITLWRRSVRGFAKPGLTPHIDALAQRSARFHHCSVQGAWTSLSVPALQWSRHPKDLKFVALYEDKSFNLHLAGQVPKGVTLVRQFQSPVHEPNPNLAEILNGRGYRTIAVPNDGFTHYFHPRLGFTRGFSEVKLVPKPQGATDPKDPRFGDDAPTVALALEALEQLGDEPFYLWVHFFGPHAPYRAPRNDDNRPPYEAEIRYSDVQFGKLLAGLQSSGRADDTIVILSADHGEAFLEHGRAHHGLNLNDEVTHVPLLIHAPGLPSGDVPQEVALIDVAPTALHLLGLPQAGSMQGRPLTPLLLAPGRGAMAERPSYLETWHTDMKSKRYDVHQIGMVGGGRKGV